MEEQLILAEEAKWDQTAVAENKADFSRAQEKEYDASDPLSYDNITNCDTTDMLHTELLKNVPLTTSILHSGNVVPMDFILNKGRHETSCLQDYILNGTPIRRIAATSSSESNETPQRTLLGFLKNLISITNNYLNTTKHTDPDKEDLGGTSTDTTDINSFFEFSVWDKDLDNEQKAVFHLVAYCFIDSCLNLDDSITKETKVSIKAKLPIRHDSPIHTGHNKHTVFAYITGAAGTGKSRCLNAFREWERAISEAIKTIPDDIVRVVAPTGIASCLIQGETIDMAIFSALGQCNRHDVNKITDFQRSLFANLGVVIIDELSMLPPQKLGKLDYIFRHLFDENKLLGGVQYHHLWGLYQLPAVKSPTFFDPYTENSPNGSTEKLI